MVSHSTKEKGVDLNQYKTYAWVKPGDEEYHITYDKKEAIPFIIDLSDEELKKKGFQKSENPDVVFLVDTQVEERVAYGRISSENAGFGVGGSMYYGGYYGSGYYGAYSGGYISPMTGTQTVETEFLQGMLFVELYDAKSKKLLWRGWAEDQITNKTDINKTIRKAVSKIFGHLPTTIK